MVSLTDILLSDDVVAEPARVREILSRRVAEVLAGESKDLHVARLVLPLPRTDPFTWLSAQSMLPRVFWSGRDDDTITAAAGSADRCFGSEDAGFRTLRAQLDMVMPHSDTRVRYFGGFRFDLNAGVGSEWESFGTFTFTLPRFEYVVRDDRAVLACNLILPRDADRLIEIRESIDALSFPNGLAEDEFPLPISREDKPDRAGWDRNVESVLNSFGHDGLQKVVLARRADFRFAERVKPFVLLRKLYEATENCFYYGFQYREGEAFLGATPERLFRRSGRRIWTEAVAGTRPRGTGSEQDELMLRELMTSDKDQREHAYVRAGISESLSPLCDSFYIDPVASKMKLARGWHLVSRSRGVLKNDVHGSDVMAALHPTPAVGGHPTPDALKAIRDLEPFDRGWYAGPVGWIGSRGAEFAVALRCGLVRRDALSLYSGCGIVEGSKPDAEWKEIEHKISDFIRVFGLELPGD